MITPVTDRESVIEDLMTEALAWYNNPATLDKSDWAIVAYWKAKAVSTEQARRDILELALYFAKQDVCFVIYWKNLQRWKENNETHAPGDLVKRDYETAKRYAELLGLEPPCPRT